MKRHLPDSIDFCMAERVRARLREAMPAHPVPAPHIMSGEAMLLRRAGAAQAALMRQVLATQISNTVYRRISSTYVFAVLFRLARQLHQGPFRHMGYAD